MMHFSTFSPLCPHAQPKASVNRWPRRLIHQHTGLAYARTGLIITHKTLIAACLLFLLGCTPDFSSDPDELLSQEQTPAQLISLPPEIEQVPQAPARSSEQNLKHWLSDNTDEALFDLPLNHEKTLKKIYAQAGYQLLWQEDQKISKAGQLLLQQLAETSADQIYDYPYHLNNLHQRLQQTAPTAKTSAALDVLMTDAFVAYADDLLTGKLLPSYMEQHLPHRKVAFVTQDILSNDVLVQANILKLFDGNHSTEGLVRTLEGMAPNHPEYAQLRKALERYQALDSRGEWRPIADGPTLEKGMQGEDIGQMRRLLSFYGDAHDATAADSRAISSDDLPTLYSDTDFNTFDSELEASLKRFQARHGQTADGRAGPITRRLLNTSPEYRVRQIALNMKRWREVPWELGDRYLWVNLTDYTLKLVTNGAIELDMKVIIGTSHRPTPAMQKTISTIVLNPYWSVPRTIAVNDLIPKTRKDPNYLSKNKIRIYSGWNSNTPIPPSSINWSTANSRNFPYRFMQDPGNQNALGRVKFVIPNGDSIYLHDTNAPELFAKDKRSLSSGCVRVSKPMELAYTLLKDTKWDEALIQKTLRSGKNVYVPLPKRLPTYLFYTTTWLDENNLVQFRDDIYDKDNLLNLASNQTAL